MKDLHVFNYKITNNSEMYGDKYIVHLADNGEGTHKEHFYVLFTGSIGLCELVNNLMIKHH